MFSGYFSCFRDFEAILGNFLVGIFFFSHSQPVPYCFGLKWSHNDGFFNFCIFLIFFWNSLFRAELEWIRTRIFFSHILNLSRLVLAWKEAIMMFFSFLNFFAIFLEYPIPGRVGLDQNENFFFSHSQPLPSRFGLKRSHNDVF